VYVITLFVVYCTANTTLEREFIVHRPCGLSFVLVKEKRGKREEKKKIRPACDSALRKEMITSNVTNNREIHCLNSFSFAG
jgi:hypothetical protein